MNYLVNHETRLVRCVVEILLILRMVAGILLSIYTIQYRDTRIRAVEFYKINCGDPDTSESTITTCLISII